MPEDAGDPSFVAAVTEWVEATWFGEQDAAARGLDAVLRHPPGEVLAGSVALLDQMLQRFLPTADTDQLAAALSAHLLMAGPDPGRETLIVDVISACRSPELRNRLARHDLGTVTGTALECLSFLSQALAEREGVIPSSILHDL